MAITKEQKLEIINKYGKTPNNTGSIEVQVALISKEIEQLTNHLIEFPKDFHSRIGIYKKSSKRYRLLQYLKKNDDLRYLNLIKDLKIRGVKD